MGAGIIAHGIANIYGGFQIVIVYNVFNIFSLGLTFGAKTLVAAKIMTQPAETDKGFDIIALAVAYNKQLVIFGQVLQCLFQLRVQVAAVVLQHLNFFYSTN